ncbi:MAG TPA: FtsX-like permease family protein [Candidatus Sulfotelmatobacter sp.]|nr:FtsX-like permease family protein [Candidatus Sulfotelmatobacter sp.]
MTLTQFVLKNAFRNPRRTLLTLLSIGFSMLLLTVMMAVWRSFYIDPLRGESAMRLVTRPRTSSIFMPSMPSYYRQQIRSIPGVVDLTPCNWFGGIYKDDKAEHLFVQMGSDPYTFLKVHPDYDIPPDQTASWQKDRAGTIVDSGLARKYGWKLGDRIVIEGRIFPVNLDLNIRGVYRAPIPTQAIIFNWQYVEEAVRSAKGHDSLYVILADSPQNVSRVATAVDGMFHNSPESTRTETEKAFELDFLSMLGTVKTFILSISFAVFFSTLLVSANTMAMSIRERTREVAVLRALGFARRTIFTLLVSEAVALCLAEGLLGSLAGYCLVYGAAQSAVSGIYSVVLKVTPLTLVVVFALSALVGILSAGISCYRASRLDIVQGLRHIG